MIAVLEKSDAAQGFEQIIDFLSGSYIHHAITVNPHVYISCIKQFWNTAVVKRSGDVTRLQALVDKKRIVITKEVVREILQLDDAEGVICLPNNEIFLGLARMGYEKPSTKLTFYKAFFSTQWKLLIHTILHSLRQRFNFLKYIFESLVRNVDSPSKFYMYPRFIQLVIQINIDDLSKHTNRYISPVLTQKVFANMRRVGKGFSGVETPLFKNMLVVRVVDAEEEVQVPAQDDVAQENVIEEVADEVVPPTPTSPSPPSPVLPSTPPHQSPSPPQSQATEGSSTLVQQVLEKCLALVLRVEGLENVNAAQKLEIVKLKARVKKLERLNKGRISVDIDEGIELEVDQEKDAEIKGRQADTQAKIYNTEEVQVPAQDDVAQENVIEEVVVEVVPPTPTSPSPPSPGIPSSPPHQSPSPPQSQATEGSSTLVQQVLEKCSALVLRVEGLENANAVQQLEIVKLIARVKKLERLNKEEELEKGHEEAYKNIDWNTAYDHVQSKGTRFDANMRFLFKSREEMEKEKEEIIKSINETPAYKAVKRRKQNEEAQKLNEEAQRQSEEAQRLTKEAQEADDLRGHLEIVPNEDDDVFVEAVPLAQKAPIVDYHVVVVDNKPKYKSR
nr:hypothetical protein [Tanacetum cinerariifolium]